MEQELLLLDLIGLAQEPERSALASALRERLGGTPWKIYLMSSTILQQAASGKLVTGAEIEAVLDQVERELVSGLHRWRATLSDFLTVLLAPPETSPRLLARIAEECAARSTRPPLVLAARMGEQEATLVEAARLPLKWRCLEGESVVLGCDVWLEDARSEAGALSVLPRGTSLLVVERVVLGHGVALRDCFLGAAAPDWLDAPLILVIPWSLAHSQQELVAGASASGSGMAVATFHLPSWYEVRPLEPPEETG